MVVLVLVEWRQHRRQAGTHNRHWDNNNNNNNRGSRGCRSVHLRKGLWTRHCCCSNRYDANIISGVACGIASHRLSLDLECSRVDMEQHVK